MILAGDIGGTHTRLALFAPDAGWIPSVERIYSSRAYAGIEEVLHAFLNEQEGRPTAVCLGVAGPVREGRCVTTNLPWVVDDAALRELLGAPAWLLNDLEANAYGLATLEPADIETLQPGAPEATGNMAIIAAGTGLGQAGLVWDGTTHRPFATEGGHASFAPACPDDDALLQWLRTRYDHVSWERVVSGPGLVALHAFLRESRADGLLSAPDPTTGEADPGAAIARAALAGTSPLAVTALDWFVRLYGAEAGNLALKTMATGGVWLGGGIAPRILPKLRSGGFLEAFRAKGRMRPLLEAVPVRVVLSDRTALRGAARFARLRLGAEPQGRPARYDG